MELVEKYVEVVSGYYKGIQGVVKRRREDNSCLIMPASESGFWVKQSELKIIMEEKMLYNDEVRNEKINA